MRIALIQPDSPHLLYPTAFPSLGLLYISAHLKKAGFKPEFFDLTGGRILHELAADVIAFSCQITQWRDVLSMRRDFHAQRFIIGGPFPTHSPERCTEFEVVKGEGETQLVKLLGGECEFDSELFPDWDAIELERYGYLLEGKNCMNLMTKRGTCPYQCAFCAKGEKTPIRFRTAENVIAEIHELRDRGFEAIAIYDDDVLLSKKRDAQIFKELKRLKMPYRCMTRTNLATREDLQLLKDTGCAEVAVGIETADRKIHHTIRKGTTLEQDVKFVRTCKELGLRVKTYFIIGLPGENPASIQQMRLWLKTEQPDNFDISVFTPYPGSHIYANKHLYEIDWDPKTLEDIWYSGEAQYTNCAVFTPYLTAHDILQSKNELVSELKRGKGGQTDYWRPKN